MRSSRPSARRWAAGRGSRFAVGAAAGGGHGVEGGLEQGASFGVEVAAQVPAAVGVGGQGELLAVGGLDLLPL